MTNNEMADGMRSDSSYLGGLFHGPADWRGSSLISRGSKLPVSQVEEIEP